MFNLSLQKHKHRVEHAEWRYKEQKTVDILQGSGRCLKACSHFTFTFPAMSMFGLNFNIMVMATQVQILYVNDPYLIQNVRSSSKSVQGRNVLLRLGEKVPNAPGRLPVDGFRVSATRYMYVRPVALNRQWKSSATSCVLTNLWNTYNTWTNCAVLRVFYTEGTIADGCISMVKLKLCYRPHPKDDGR